MIGERGDKGEWDTFIFEGLDADGEETRFTIDSGDLPDGYDWDDFFDYLDDYLDDYDIDYKNPYGE